LLKFTNKMHYTTFIKSILRHSVSLFNYKLLSLLLFQFVIITFTTNSKAQDKNVLYTIQGNVISNNTGQPLVGVSVFTNNQLYGTATDKHGKFLLKLYSLPNDSIKVCFRILGYQDYSQIVKLNSKNILIKLKEDNLLLSEVVVTAKKNKQTGSESQINNQAIEHLQATNLGEVMQLLPGQLQQNPTLTNPSQIVLRQALHLNNKNSISYGNKEAMNSIGLKTIIDGMPLSNNANLQIENIANAYSLNPSNSFSTVTGRGADMRMVTTQNIESVTVIPGIPSVKYGDLTTGAVIVETKTGKSPLEMQIKTDPRLVQAGIDKGLKIGENGSALNLHLDYTKSLKSENEDEFAYKKVNTSLVYSNSFLPNNNLVTKTNISYTTSFDDFYSGVNMQEEEKIKSSNEYLSISTRGKLYITNKWLKKAQYQLGYSRQWQNSDITKYRSEAMQTIATAHTDTMMAVDVVPYTYLYNLKVEGIPTQYYAKLNSEYSFKILNSKNNLLFGGEWTTEKNEGRGKIFDIHNPPGNFNANSLRPRSYKDIPALNSLSLYIEDNLNISILNKQLIARMGIRYDNYDPTSNSTLKDHTYLSPRLNFSYALLKKLKVKGGWGKTAKSIPMLYLFPEKAYFDYLNLNYYNSLSNGDKEYFFLNTTKVYKTANPSLKVATANKFECGLNYSNKYFNVDVTLYDEQVNNAYTLTRQPVLLRRDKYKLKEYIDNKNSSYTYVETDTLSRSYTYPSNDRKIVNKGIEVRVEIPEIKALKTSFTLNGSYVQTEYEYQVEHIYSSSWNSFVFPVFKAGDGSYDEMLMTNLTAIHHVSALRYVISLGMQTIWRESNYSYYANNSEYPIYLIKKGIKTFQITSKEKDDFKRNTHTGNIEETKPPLFLFNLRLTKEIGDRCKVMVSINNLFFNNPIYKYKRYTNTYATRNPSVYYGFKLSYKL